MHFSLMSASEDRVDNTFCKFTVSQTCEWCPLTSNPWTDTHTHTHTHTHTPPMFNLFLYLGQLQAELQSIIHPLKDSKSCYVSVFKVTASVTVACATARKVGLERNAIILSPARCLWKPVRRSVGEPPACPALAEVIKSSVYSAAPECVPTETFHRSEVLHLWVAW